MNFLAMERSVAPCNSRLSVIINPRKMRRPRPTRAVQLCEIPEEVREISII